MKASEDLFELIHSLSKAEKRHFKLSLSSFKEGSNLLKLFEAINKQDSYDEAAIKKKFASEKFVKQLSVTKNHLYKTILKSLRAFHADISSSAQLYELLHSAEILHTKNLFDAASKLIKKAKKLAISAENNIVLVDIYHWERKLAAAAYYAHSSDEELSKGIGEGLEVVEAISAELRYEFESARVFNYFYKNGLPRSGEDITDLDEIFDLDIFKNEKLATTFRSKFIYLNTWGYYYGCLRDYDKSYDLLTRLVAHMEEFPQFTSRMLPNYITMLNNLHIVQFELGKYDECGATLKRLLAIETNYAKQMTPQLESLVFCNYYALRCNALINKGEFSADSEFLKTLEKGLDQYEMKSWYQLYFLYNISYIYYGARGYRSALRWINRLLNEFDEETGRDIYCFARILNLFIHLELENRELVESVARSTSKFLEKKKRMFKVEEIVMRFIQHAAFTFEKENMRNNLLTFKNELDDATKDNEQEKIALQYIDFNAWLNHKLNDISFEEACQVNFALMSS